MGAGTSLPQAAAGWEDVPTADRDLRDAALIWSDSALEGAGCQQQVDFVPRGRRLRPVVCMLASLCAVLALVCASSRRPLSSRAAAVAAVGFSDSGGGDHLERVGHVRFAYHSDLCFRVSGDWDVSDDTHVWGGTRMQLMGCDDGPREQFQFPKSRGLVRWHSRPEMCLDVAGGRTTPGNWLQLWHCDSSLESQQWVMPEMGEGPMRWAAHPELCLDGSRWAVHNKRPGATLQIWPCQGSGEASSDQLFEIPALVGLPQEFVASTVHECEERLWPGRVDDRVCSKCTVPIESARLDSTSCSQYCSGVGRFCQRAHVAAAGDACEKAEEVSCAAEAKEGASPAICECGAKILRGQYGFLSDFSVSEVGIRRMVIEMREAFNIKEVQFFGAFEGFSRPPGFYKDQWRCSSGGRLVMKSVVRAAADQIKEIGGRSWLAIYADAADVGDEGLVAGREAPRLEDVRVRGGAARGVGEAPVPGRPHGGQLAAAGTVVLDEAWALKFAPRWADFAASLNVSGIHWMTSWVPAAEARVKPDVRGFLRAALPILRARGLEQTMTFVDGFGWDPELFATSSHLMAYRGPEIAFPVFEFWGAPSAALHSRTIGLTQGYVVAQTLGGAAEKRSSGALHLDAALGQCRAALKSKAGCILVGDGLRYASGWNLRESVAISGTDFEQLQAEVSGMQSVKVHTVGMAHPFDNEHHYSTYLYAVFTKKIFRQPLAIADTAAGAADTDGVAVSNHWVQADETDVADIAWDAGQQLLYAAASSGHVLRRGLGSAEWRTVADKAFRSLAVYQGTLFGVTHSGSLYKASTDDLADSGSWRLLSNNPVRSICVHRGVIFATTDEGLVVKQDVSSITEDSAWSVAAKAPVHSLAVVDDILYATTPSGTLVRQRLSHLSATSPWVPTGTSEGVTSMAVVTGLVEL